MTKNQMLKTTTIEPEFMDLATLEKVFGIRRSLAYTLMGEGKIKGISLLSEGKTRGKRLIQVASVREFLNQQMEQNG